MICLRLLESSSDNIPDFIKDELDHETISKLTRRFRSWGDTDGWRDSPFYPRPRKEK